MNSTSSASGRVIVVPVAIRLESPVAPHGDDGDGGAYQPWLAGVVSASESTFLTVRRSPVHPGSRTGWPEGEIGPGTRPSDAALALTKDFASKVLVQFPLERDSLHAVGFIEPRAEGEPVTFIYTCALPVTAPEVEPQNDGAWSNIHDLATRNSPVDTIEPLRMVREYWRKEMEETTRVFDLLPRYFTMSQLKEAYVAVWDRSRAREGVRQLDWSNFQDWATKKNPSLVKPVSDTASIETKRDQILTDKGGAAALRLVTTAVGANVGNLKVPFGALAAGVGVGIAIAAGAVAYQVARPGKPPKWYTRGTVDTTQLEVRFDLKPYWLRKARGSDEANARSAGGKTGAKR